jgi:hypothetical protein
VRSAQGHFDLVRLHGLVLGVVRLSATRFHGAGIMREPIRILLQTTIPEWDDDWHVGAFLPCVPICSPRSMRTELRFSK